MIKEQVTLDEVLVLLNEFCELDGTVSGFKRTPNA